MGGDEKHTLIRKSNKERERGMGKITMLEKFDNRTWNMQLISNTVPQLNYGQTKSTATGGHFVYIFLGESD